MLNLKSATLKITTTWKFELSLQKISPGLYQKTIIRQRKLLKSNINWIVNRSVGNPVSFRIRLRRFSTIST